MKSGLVDAISSDPIIGKIRQLIVDAIAPDKIILFGSRARGDARENSDYDILVIKTDIENERSITRQINYLLFDAKIEKVVDILATTPEKWKKNKDDIGLIYRNIDQDGLIIYE